MSAKPAYRDRKPFHVRNNELFVTYKRTLAATRRKLIRSKMKRADKRKLETELAWIIKEIDDYGFNFFPDHYVQDNVNRIARLVA